MSATVKIFNHLEVTIGGELKEIGSRATPESVTITGYCYDVTVVVADKYTRQVMWQNGDGGINTFAILAVESDKNIILELTIDRAGTPKYASIGVLAGVPVILTTDDLLGAITVNETQTTMDQVDQVAVQNTLADAAGDAVVRLLLLL